MAVRITGLVSGLDTDSIVQELVSAYSAKQTKIEKKQTKLSWTQDAWKEMNTKIYGFYSSSLTDFKFMSNFDGMKKVNVGDPTKATITAGAGVTNGTQTLKINKLATGGYLTGAKLKGKDGALTKSTKLSELGIKNTELKIKVGDKESTIRVDKNMTIRDLTKALNDEGVTANFDEAQQRFFIQSADTGTDFEFSFSNNTGDGLDALQKLGLLTEADVAQTTAQKTANGLSGVSLGSSVGIFTKMSELGVDGKTFKFNVDGREGQVEITEDMTVRDFLAALNEKGVKANYDTTGRKFVISNDVTFSTDTAEEIESLQKIGLATEDDEAKLSAIRQTKSDIAGLMGSDEIRSSAMNLAGLSSLADFDALSLDDKRKYLNAAIIKSEDEANGVTKPESYYQDETAMSDRMEELNDRKIAEYTAKYKAEHAQGKIEYATKQAASNAEIEVNGAVFEGSSNTFSINGMTITAKGVTDSAMSIVTETDVDAIYDKIVGFIKDYNEVINAMDGAYNAEAAKGYEPLTNDEKDSMSDKEVEEWEKKIKDSLLRRDSTLNSIASSMKMAMAKSYTINGKSYSLSSFGINTLGYFVSADNEKNAYHIDGYAEDDSAKNNTDKLKAAIASDPDTVATFFNELAKGLYKELDDRMGSTRLSSAYKVYNDKQMQSEYDDYADQIKKWKEKVEYMEEYYYDKFAAMEAALSKLNSQQSQLSGLLGM